MAWVPSERVLCSGDIVVSPIPYASASFPREWIEVLGKLETYDFKVLIPGHGEPLADHAYVDHLIAALTEVRSRVMPLASAGVTLDEVYKRPDFTRLTEGFAGKDPWLNILFNSFFLRSIVKNAYFEATGQAIVQGG